jgi:hypothetical protein
MSSSRLNTNILQNYHFHLEKLDIDFNCWLLNLKTHLYVTSCGACICSKKFNEFCYLILGKFKVEISTIYIYLHEQWFAVIYMTFIWYYNFSWWWFFELRLKHVALKLYNNMICNLDVTDGLPLFTPCSFRLSVAEWWDFSFLFPCVLFCGHSKF